MKFYALLWAIKGTGLIVIKKYPLLSRFLLVVFLPAMVVLSVLFVNLKTSLAPMAGDMAVAGLHGPVKITHDFYGTPSIEATTDRDAYFAIGFKHASDRLWQLELQRRLAQGRLSEVFGANAISQDIWMRTLGLHHAAKESIAYLSSETIDALTAYSEGINTWIAQAPSLPIEFQLLGIHPEPWTIYDSLSWQKVFSLTLSGNMYDEMRRNLLQARLTPQQLKYFYPYDPDQLNAHTAPTIENTLIAQRNKLLPFGIGHPFTGSNAWVISGKYTKSGHPLLANDPHVGLQLPALWYPAALKGDRLDVSGMTLVGLPLIIFGQNSAISWGGTSLESDQEDLFIETTSPKYPNQYKNGDEWQVFESRTELINVSAAFPAALNEKLNPVSIQVRKTVRGPVISDAGEGTDEIISLRWSALDSEDHTIEAFLQLQYAKNWRDFRQALAIVKSPGLSFVYADRAGNIGYQVAGMFPKRGEGVGILPLIASAHSDWQGYYDFDMLPSVLNPEQGFIVSANEQVSHSPDIIISHEWAPKARHTRISYLLQKAINNGKPMTAEDMAEIQSDRVDLTAVELLGYLRNIEGETAQEKAALAALQQWNGEFRGDSVSASIFATWSYYLTNQIFGDVLSYNWLRPDTGVLLQGTLAQMDWAQLAKVVASNDHGWCQDNQNIACELELKQSLKAALKQLERITDEKSIENWQWHSIARTDFLHQPFGQIKGAEYFFSRTAKAVASPNSINASNLQFDNFKGFSQNFGASFRQVFELNEKAGHWYLLSTGVSGNVMSPHFDDMMDSFVSNSLIPFSARHHTQRQLNLLPAAVD